MFTHVIDISLGNGVFNFHNEALVSLLTNEKMIFPEYPVCTTWLFTFFARRKHFYIQKQVDYLQTAPPHSKTPPLMTICEQVFTNPWCEQKILPTRWGRLPQQGSTAE
jgi:hypothetical protein